MKGVSKVDKFMAAVKVGPKGQIVIPKEVRDMFAIEPGDSLVILSDAKLRAKGKFIIQPQK